jgi:hypothetical protein
VVLWRLRYKLSLRDLTEMFLIRGIKSARQSASLRPRDHLALQNRFYLVA